MRVRQSFWCIFRFLCIWLNDFVLFFLFCQKKMQWRAPAIFFLKFLDGWILFAIFATKKDAAEIKLRERGSLYQSAARLSLEGTASGCSSSSRLLPQSLYVCESLWKIASLLSKKHGRKIAKQNDTFRYCLCSSSAINIDNVTRSSMGERSTGDQTIILDLQIFLDHRSSRTRVYTIVLLSFCLDMPAFLGDGDQKVSDGIGWMDGYHRPTVF